MMKAFLISVLGVLMFSTGWLPLQVLSVLPLLVFPAWFVENVVLRNYHSPAYRKAMANLQAAREPK
jgi:hypothetical protein